jgi:bacillithiol biosynthesis cysteine-adding enzyme BshC
VRIESDSFTDLPFSALFKAYASGDSRLNPFFEHYPVNPTSLSDAARSHRWSGDRAAMVRILTDINTPFRPHPAAMENIRRLGQDGALAMVTGQQLTVFGGPLFTIYKLITAIVLARKLEAETGKPVIPVFWMADEDNDYAEIAGIGFPSKGGWFSDALAPDSHIPHSAGFLNVGSDIDRLMSAVDEALTPGDHHEAVLSLLRDSYGSGVSHPLAFGALLSKLFSKHGLVLAGSTSAEAKALLAPAMIRYAERYEACRTALETSSDAMSKVFHAQAAVGSTLLFEHTPTQGRVKIDRITPQLIERIRTSPELFSPNVFLRPVLQDTLLPTVAYIGGPGEIAYYAQMKTFYKVMECPMPVILPRFSATVMEANIRRNLEDAVLPWTSHNRRVEDLDADVLRTSDAPDVDSNLERWRAELERIHAEHGAWIAEVDATLAASAESVLKEQQNALEKLRQKLMRALKQKEETRLRRSRQIRESLFPNGNLQEREWAMIHVMNRYGLGVWDELIEAWSEAFPDTHMRIEP